MTLEYSLWSEIIGSETCWFWLVDEISDDPMKEDKTIAGGIEDTKGLALKEIRKYVSDA